MFQILKCIIDRKPCLKISYKWALHQESWYPGKSCALLSSQESTYSTSCIWKVRDRQTLPLEWPLETQDPALAALLNNQGSATFTHAGVFPEEEHGALNFSCINKGTTVSFSVRVFSRWSCLNLNVKENKNTLICSSFSATAAQLADSVYWELVLLSASHPVSSAW